MDLSEYSKQEKKFLSRNALLIEKVLESLGFITRIVELKTYPKYYQYNLEVTVGTDLIELEKHRRNLALALASPTGKVKMIIPIPGRSLVGIQVPKPTKEEILNMKFEEVDITKNEYTWKNLIAAPFYITSYFFKKIGEKIETI